MEIIKAKAVTETEFDLVSVKDIEKVFSLIEDNINFVLQWDEGAILRSKLIVATNVSGSIKNGGLILTATTPKGASE